MGIGGRVDDLEVGRAGFGCAAGEAIAVQGWRGRTIGAGARPLDAAFFAGGVEELGRTRGIDAGFHHQGGFGGQAGVADAAVVDGDGSELVHYRRWVGVVDAGNVEALGELGQYPAFGHGVVVPDGYRRAHALDATLEIGEGAVFFGEGGAGQHHIGDLGCRGQKRLGHDEEIEAFERVNTVSEGAAGEVVAVADQEHGLDGSVGGGLQH